MFGCIAVLSPPIANFVKDAGYDTVEKFTEWVRQPANPPLQAAPAGPAAGAPPAGAPPAGARAGGPGGGRGGGRGGFGGAATLPSLLPVRSNNNYWMMGGMVPAQAVQIDKWR